MRKFFTGALVGTLFLVLAAVAYAVTDTMKFTSVTKSSVRKPTKLKPGNLFYRGTIAIDTNPAGQQPDAAPSTTIFFDKAIIRTSAPKWASCTQSEIDGKETVSAKCKKARISVPGKSTATAYAGTPGNPKAQSVREDLSVEAYNGPSGKKIFLAVTSKPGAPVKLSNRIVPGTVVRASGTYGFAVRFDIPTDLQEQLGLKISLTNFDVHISSATRLIGGKRRSYLQLTSCRTRKLAVKAETKFRDAQTNQLKAVTSVSSSRCP